MASRTVSPQRERAAVSALFFVNGFIIGSWAVYIPEFARRLDIDEGTLGFLIAVFGLGSLIAMPVTGTAIAKFGHAPVTRWLSSAAATSLIWLGLAPGLGLAFGAMLVFGALIASMDVAMNASAVDLEKRLTNPIMSSCHGFWSLGGLAGAFAGGWLLQAYGGSAQLIAASSVSLLAVGSAVRAILPGAVVEGAEILAPAFPRSRLPYLIGLIALLSAMPEGAVIDWSVLYMQTDLSAAPVTASMAFALFSGAMAIVRFAGDPLRKRFGSVATVRLCAAIAGAGFLLAGLSDDPWLAIAGFTLTGLGLANMVPIAFSAAGNLPGLAPGIGISVATTIGYSGVLFFPALLGHLAEFIGFSMLFTVLALPVIALLAMAPLTRYAD